MDTETAPGGEAPEAPSPFDLPDLDAVIASHAAPDEAPEAPAEAAPEAPSPPPAPEAPAPEPPAETAGDLARLMAEERAVRARTEERAREQESRFAEERRALEERAREVEEMARRLEPLQRLNRTILDKDASALAEHYGLSPEEFAERVKEGTGADPMHRMRSELTQQLEALRAEQEKLREATTSWQRERDEEAARAELSAGFAAYSPAVAALAAVNPRVYDAAMGKIRAHYQQNGQVPELTQVTADLEREAVDEFLVLAEALWPHIPDDRKQSLMAPAAAGDETPREEKRSTEPQHRPPKLSNADQASPGGRIEVTEDFQATGDLSVDLAATMRRHGFA